MAAYQPHPAVNAPYPLLCDCRDNAKLACHCTARYKIEWIYMRSKVRGPDSLELALEMRKKEERMRKIIISGAEQSLIRGKTWQKMSSLVLDLLLIYQLSTVAVKKTVTLPFHSILFRRCCTFHTSRTISVPHAHVHN